MVVTKSANWDDVRHLSIYLWDRNVASGQRLHELLRMKNESPEMLHSYWNGLRETYDLPGLKEAADAGRALVFEYGSQGTRILCPGDVDYPTALFVMKHAPIVGVRGNPDVLKSKQIAIVGSRLVYEDAVSVTSMIADDVMSRGFVITSGGALGIDALAHRQAMTRHQPTVVVSALGCDHIYPRENRDIFEYAWHCGAVVSQFPNRKMVHKPNFPQRNDIIAALGCATIVVQCPEKSGALYTVKAAMKFGRPVFAAAMPGFNALTEGGLTCIKTGAARMLSNVHDLDCLEGQRSLQLGTEMADMAGELPESCTETAEMPILRIPKNMAHKEDRVECECAAAKTETQKGIVKWLKKGALTREQLRTAVGEPVDFDEGVLELELYGAISYGGGQFRFVQRA